MEFEGTKTSPIIVKRYPATGMARRQCSCLFLGNGRSSDNPPPQKEAPTPSRHCCCRLHHNTQVFKNPKGLPIISWLKTSHVSNLQRPLIIQPIHPEMPWIRQQLHLRHLQLARTPVAPCGLKHFGRRIFGRRLISKERPAQWHGR